MTIQLPVPRAARRGALLLLALPGALVAQADAPPLSALDTGSVVRVQAGASGRWRVGRLRRVTGDTIWIAHLAALRDRRPAPLVAPPDRSRVEVSPDFDAVSRQRHRLIAGCTLGGILYGLVRADANYPRGVSAVVGGLAGVTIGSLAAEVSRPRRWIAVRR